MTHAGREPPQKRFFVHAGAVEGTISERTVDPNLDPQGVEQDGKEWWNVCSRVHSNGEWQGRYSPDIAVAVCQAGGQGRATKRTSGGWLGTA
jgi:hypothetical protein